MSVSGTLAINQATLLAGRTGIQNQRGMETWGANYIYNSGGLQEDILVLSDVLSNLSSSGAYATDAELAAVSGAITTDGVLNYPTITSVGNSVPSIVSGFLRFPTLDTSALTPRTSGDASSTLGSQASPLSSGGIIMTSAGGAVYQVFCDNFGNISGVAI